MPAQHVSAATTWNRWEQELVSSGDYSNPYADVRVSVSYSGPHGRVIEGTGFWDGCRAFRIRCMFPSPGTWTWETLCSDTTNGGLHEQ